MSEIERYTDEKKAIARAKQMSRDSEVTYLVILSAGWYYIDTNDFIRNWEILICKIKKGKIKK